MSLIASVIRAAERAPLPDSLAQMGIELLVGRTRRKLATEGPLAESDFVRAMGEHRIAEYADAANKQHYELPPEFFALTLGPRRKYSCCLYRTGEETLADAERMSLEETVRHADLADGQAILELGCGWGSLTPWCWPSMASLNGREDVARLSPLVPPPHPHARLAAGDPRGLRLLCDPDATEGR